MAERLIASMGIDGAREVKRPAIRHESAKTERNGTDPKDPALV